MKIGLLADIHGELENLRSALTTLRRERVERIIVLGDVIESTRNAAETVALLQAVDAAGVWGNHELGLCVAPTPAIRAAYPGNVVDFFETLQPHFELGELLFSHGLPSQDPGDPAAYYLGPRPNENGARADCFAQFTHRVMFMGHFHRWFAATATAATSWAGDEPFEFESDQRYLVVVNALLDGWFAIHDDATNLLTPYRVA